MEQQLDRIKLEVDTLTLLQAGRTTSSRWPSGCFSSKCNLDDVGLSDNIKEVAELVVDFFLAGYSGARTKSLVSSSKSSVDILKSFVGDKLFKLSSEFEIFRFLGFKKIFFNFFFPRNAIFRFFMFDTT